MKQAFTLPYKPNSTNNHWKRNKNGGVRLSKKGEEFRENVQQYMKLYKYKTFQGDVKVTLNIYFKDKRKRDLDNCFKPIFDCFNGILYEDDSQIVEIHSRKLKAKNDYFEIEVEEVAG